MSRISYNQQQLLEAVKKSNCISQVLNNLGLSHTGANHNLVKRKIKYLNIDVSHWKNYKQLFRNKIELCDILKKDTRYNSNHLRKRLIKEKIFKNKCSECNIIDWNNKPISLHLDHINGINTDNRLENLRILCPNCHSQTETFGGKNHKRNKQQYYCTLCNEQVTKNQNRCWPCYIKNRTIKTKIQWPSIEELIEQLKIKPRTVLAKELGVSDNAIKKHINKYSKLGRCITTLPAD